MKKKLSNEELITFCGQMALILKSGISSLEGIYIMEDGDVQTEGREILKEIREELEMCGMLYPAMKKTGVFPEYALHMTEIGEQTGRLDETMEALAAYYQREEEILDEVKSAVTYPVAMLGMLLVIVAVLFIKVMPVFEQVYMQLGQEMTGVARQLLNIGDWMRQSAIVLVVLAVVILIIVFFFIFYKKARIEFISKIQTIGFMKKIAWKRARTRFASGMAMALKSGLDMDESLSLSEKLTDYEPLKMKIQQCQEQMKQGETFPKALKETRIFDGMQERLMIIGYETGAVDEVMEQAADLYQKQLQDQIQKMIAVLEPTLVGILCVIVGIILLSVMLPLVGIMAGIGLGRQILRNRFQKQRKIDNKIRIFLPVMICGIMVAVLWNSSSQIFRETKKRQEESLKEAVIKGAVQCYSVEGRYPESLSYMEKHYGLEYDKDEFVISYEIIGSNRMPQVTVIPLNER